MTSLRQTDIRRFLAALARRLPCPTRLVLTGGSEAMLLGGSRPTADLDFGVHLPKRSERLWPQVEAAIAAASRETRVAVQYSTDIDRWSPVSIPAAAYRTRPFRKLGRLSVHVLEPRCWAVYKLARYLDSDVEDLRAVLPAQRVRPLALARLCAASLRASPRSTSLSLFRRQVEHFFREHGAAIWGAEFAAARAIRVFRAAAGITARPPGSPKLSSSRAGSAAARRES